MSTVVNSRHATAGHKILDYLTQRRTLTSLKAAAIRFGSELVRRENSAAEAVSA
jgi:hypothetical protein